MDSKSYHIGRFSWRIMPEPGRLGWRIAVGLAGGNQDFHRRTGRLGWRLETKSVGTTGECHFFHSSHRLESVGLAGASLQHR